MVSTQREKIPIKASYKALNYITHEGVLTEKTENEMSYKKPKPNL